MPDNRSAKALEKAVENGYVNGSGGILNQKGKITRAQFAVIMDNVIKKYVRLEKDAVNLKMEGNVIVNSPSIHLKNYVIIRISF